jgi:hypothetical protein
MQFGLNRLFQLREDIFAIFNPTKLPADQGQQFITGWLAETIAVDKLEIEIHLAAVGEKTCQVAFTRSAEPNHGDAFPTLHAFKDALHLSVPVCFRIAVPN